MSNHSETTSSAENKIHTPSISLPKGGGAVKGIGETFQPNAFSGTGSYSVPIPLTPARGFEPQLHLSYGSGDGNDVFGMGFSLSIPKISRKTDTGIPKYNGDDIFILAGEGELTPKLINNNGEWSVAETIKPDNGVSWKVLTFLPREQGSFSLIEQWTDPSTGESWWQVTSRNNITTQYGRNKSARIADPEDETRIFEWLIEETFDSKGNRIIYHYKPEDGNNISNQIYEVNRSFQAKKYIRSIQYGNYFLDGSTENEKFAFEVVFDYGEYNPVQSNSDPYHPVREWPERTDPFSTYRSGFEIRTFRLCRNILIFHNFKELGDKPCLVKALQFAHDETPSFSFLKSVTQTGYRINPDGSYNSQSLPPLEFEYSQFSPPKTPGFKPLTVNGIDTIPGYLDRADFQPLDLKGEGLPGMLLSNAETTFYYEPIGNGSYLSPSVPASFPNTKNFQNPALSLQSLEGNGQLELVVNSSQMAGYYSQEYDGSWSAFRNFQSIPTDLVNPHRESADLDGNGKADLLMLSDPDLVFYPSEGKIGYGTPKRVPLQQEFPVATNYGERELVTFANVFGDGLSHRVRIRDGSVEVWPNLGYGRFGKKVTLANAPRFDSTTSVSRIFLADIDGSGTMDLVFAYTDRVEIYLNQIGNSFANTPLTLYLPDGFSDIDQIQFADILGEGTSALVFTKAGPIMSHWYYNFCGERAELTPALKPYLLTKINNNLGATTEIYYASSTKFYLEDKKAGRPWTTRLPFPVQVVEKTVVTDEISGSRLTSSHKYHDGYYDPVEREFRGFGFVESWDTESFEDYQKSISNPAFPSDRLNKKLYVPPVYTKTWHHTGAYFENEVITKQYEKAYFQGDKNAYVFPDSVFDPAVFQSDSETIRQAYAALKGAVMRQEVYALDGSDKQENPYTATESNVEVQLIQPKGDQQYAVFHVNPRESISYHYERNPSDPRVQQEFTLEVDPLCGETIKACTVFLPRRSVSSSPVYPEQKKLTVTAVHNDYINTLDTESYRYRGVPYQTQAFEIFGLDLNGKQYCSFDDVVPVKSALETPIPYQAAVTPGQLQARQLAWNKHFFWNEEQPNDPPLLGKISSHALLHHNESAVFTKEFVSEAFGPQLTDDTIQSQGGYVFDTQSGYWWDKGLTQFYFTTPASFYLPCKTENSFADPSSSLFVKSTVEYDQPYYFSAVKATQYIDEANKIENVVTAQIDYVTLQPYQLVDINGNVSQALFDPLGQVIVTTLFGMENGKPVGGMRLYPYAGKPAEYAGRQDAVFDQVWNNPKKYLQGATSYFYYDLLSWKDKKQPPCAINLIRDNFYLNAQGLSEFTCKITIGYSDGFARELESKLKTDDCWIVSGRTVYNNKGKTCEQYLPYFSNTPAFETQQDIIDQKLFPPPTVMHYDPLLRVMQVDTPKGFFSKVDFTPWEEKHYDEDDTVIDSAYYIDFMNKYPKSPNKPTQAQIDEKDALDKAAKFYNTPSRTILDNAGHQIRAIENNLGNVSADIFKDIVKSSTVTPDALFNELIAKGYLATCSIAPIGTWVTDKFQPYSPGFVLALDNPYQQFSGPVTDLLKQNALMSFIENDTLGRVTASIDARLYYANQAKGAGYYNFKYRYAMGEKDPVYIASIDAGIEKHLSNIYGNQLWSLSSRNYCQLISYDRLQRRSAVSVKKLTDDHPITSYADFKRVEVFEYGEAHPELPGCNLRGQLYQLKDLSGIVINRQYSLMGEILETSRQMATAYKNPVDWNTTTRLKKSHISRFTYDALQHVITETTPDGSVTTNAYNQAGFLNQVKVTFIDKTEQQIIKRIEYDAKGQRTAIQYGNGIITNYAYEPATLHLTGISSTRPKNGGTETVQDITYAYDPAGNITRSWNNTFKTVFNKNQAVDPLSDYSYDALYRLIAANGRQHPGINAGTYKNNLKDGDLKQCLFSNINDADKLENYNEVYSYDDSGNLIRKQHIAASSSWNRETPVEDNSNRLKDLTYDASGNLRQLNINNPVNLSFNCCENLVKAKIIQRPDELDDCDYYVYDSGERRTRKVSERMVNGGAVTLIEEKTYFGNYEVKHNKSVDAQGKKTTVMERQTLRIMDGSTCVAIVHYCVKGDEAGTRKLRYQLSDNLGSISSEYDKDAQLITYEEYFPYGGTAIIAGTSQAEVKLKDYRYSGKERDDSTGLYYYGARYYAPWLGRWLNPDPAGTVDGMNLYAFVGGNPINLVDPTGKAKQKKEDTGALVQSVRFMKSKELEKSLEIANKVFNEAYVKPSLFIDESAEFSKPLQKELTGIFSDFAGSFSAINPTLNSALVKAGAANDEMASDQRGAYKKLRTKSNATIQTSFSDLDFDPQPGIKTFELHHLMYKAMFPKYAITSSNFAMSTRGSSRSGLIGTHEGLFHLITSGNDSSIYTRSIAGVSGFIKRMIIKRIGTRKWLKLIKGGPYSMPGTGQTTDFRSKSMRIQLLAARKREIAGGSTDFLGTQGSYTPQKMTKTYRRRFKPY
ncbi:MAG: SpvB/TcaC N-terminal domain-containing protein [Methylobacter sp.]